MAVDYSNDQPTKGTKRPKPPSDFEDEADFLHHMRRTFHDDIQYDRNNREAALEDLRFMVGDQWDDIVRQRREASRKPCLTVNRMPAFVGQIVGARRQNETVIKVLPDQNGTVPVAKLREGLMRSIQKISRAQIAYDSALANQVMCGIGNFQVCLDWESDDVFTQNIRIEQIPDALAVVWDRELIDPTGADAKHCFVVESMTKQAFQKKWPWATPADVMVDVTLRGDLRMDGWITVDDVRVVNYWRIRTKKRTIALMQDGSVQDITETKDPQVLAQIVQRPHDGTPVMREVDMRYAEMYVCSGQDILEGPYHLPVDRVPVLRVPGWEVWVGQWKHRWGLVRFLKDPQRLHNYFRSVWAEKVTQTPRAVWLASTDAVSGREAAFRQSHLSDDPLLIYNAEAGQKPERVPPAQIEEALIGLAEAAAQDIKDVSNIHEANLGMPSNEISGAAINARQRVSDTGTILYHDNLDLAIEECGRVINQLIPFAYDTPRIIKVIGDDAKEELVAINADGAPDISAGKYTVSVSTGPSTVTRRIEAADHMMNLINAAPQVAPIIMDLLVQAQDWPMADEIARRLRSQLPPGVLDPKDMSPEQRQAAQSAAQDQDAQKRLMMQQAVEDYMKTQSETALNMARAKNFDVTADATGARVQNEAVNIASQAAEREMNAHLKVTELAHGGK